MIVEAGLGMTVPPPFALGDRPIGRKCPYARPVRFALCVVGQGVDVIPLTIRLTGRVDGNTVDRRGRGQRVRDRDLVADPLDLLAESGRVAQAVDDVAEVDDLAVVDREEAAIAGAVPVVVEERLGCGAGVTAIILVSVLVGQSGPRRKGSSGR